MSSLSDVNFNDIVFAAPSFKIPSQQEIEQELDEYEIIESNVEYINELKAKKELNSSEEQDYNQHVLSITNTNFTERDKGYRVQHRDLNNYYVNYVNDVKYRSKGGIPQINNIQCFVCNTMKNTTITEGRKGEIEKINQVNSEFDYNTSNIIKALDEGLYELIPYQSVNLYGCSFVKTCFNTIGKDYEYIHPFIDYDLDESKDTISNELNKLYSIVSYMISNVLGIQNINDVSFSIIGYSNIIQEDFYSIFTTSDKYIKLQSKPNAHKYLSVHIVFYNIKIHCIEFKSRIEQHIGYFNQFKAFDVAPYHSGSLRHIGSVKSGLVNSAEALSKKVDNLSPCEILHQFITYHNKYINYKYIHLNINNIHNNPRIPNELNNIKNQNHQFDIEIYYGNEKLNPYNIESLINIILTKSNVDMSYHNRWNFLAKYVMYKKSIKSTITDENINFILPGHTSTRTQISFFESELNIANPKPLLNYLKTLELEIGDGITALDFKIKYHNKYITPSHFGSHNVEELRNAKDYKDIIEIITGSFSISSDGNLHYICRDGIREYKLIGRPNDYIAKLFPSKLIKIITLESEEMNSNSDTSENESNESLASLFKFKLEELQSSKKKAQLRLSAHTFIQVLIKYMDVFVKDAFTRFKLNGYSVDKVNSQAYEDVKSIIKLFEDQLVDELKTERPGDNPIQELLRCIKHLIVNNEKVEKGFMVVDRFGATGKTLLFGKIFIDFFGIAGINRDSVTKINSNFSDDYNYLFTVHNEVEKGKATLEQCSSFFKQSTDSIMNSYNVKNVQEPILAKNTNIPVFLSNSYDLNGAFDVSDPALVGRYVFIEFKPFENNGNVDTLKGLEYYALVDKYKSRKDLHHIFNYDFRNALYKYIMELDISKDTVGRAQPSKYKEEKFMDIAKDRISQITENDEKKPYIMKNNLYNLDLQTKTLTPYTEDNNGLVGFQISKLINVPSQKRELFLKILGYKSALRKKTRFNLNSKQWNTELIICDKSKLVELLEVKEPLQINM